MSCVLSWHKISLWTIFQFKLRSQQKVFFFPCNWWATVLKCVRSMFANATVNKLHDVWNDLLNETFTPHSPVRLTSSSHWYLKMHQDKTWHLLTSVVHYMHVRPSITPSIFSQYCPSWCLTHGRMRTEPCGFNRIHITKPPGLIECLFCGFKRIVQPKKIKIHSCHLLLTFMIFFFRFPLLRSTEERKYRFWATWGQEMMKPF